VRPSEIAPGGEGTIAVAATNLGDVRTSGDVTLSDVLPAGLTVVEHEGVPVVNGVDTRGAPVVCGCLGQHVSCELLIGEEEDFTQSPYEYVEMTIQVKATGEVSGEQLMEVSGGGAAGVQLHRPVPVGGQPVGFGVETFEQVPEEAGGGVDAQAGSHPFQLSTTFALNQTSDPIRPPALAENLAFRLPAGLIGNATVLAQCSEEDFREIISTQNACPADAAVGVVIVYFDEPSNLGLKRYAVPIFNLVPARGEPARFGFTVVKTPVTLDTSVRTGSDYGVTVKVSKISTSINFLSETAVFWGVPSDPRHNESRGWACLARGLFREVEEGCEHTNAATVPFLTMPSSCREPFVVGVEGNSWPTMTSAGLESLALPPQQYALQDQFARPIGLAGCNDLPFDPAVEVAPDVQAGSTPTGLKVDVRVPQEVNDNPGGLDSSSVKDIKVAFPVGLSVSPAAADGLEACSEGQVGFTGVTAGTDQFTPTLPEAFCPDASKIGTVKIKVPVIADPLEGALYLASQDANPFGSLIASYIVAEDPVSGVLVKLAGEVSLNGENGQITATFDNSPQAPLEEAEIHLFGGARAPFSTPAVCQSYTTEATFTPWSETPPVTSDSTFAVTSGPNSSQTCHNPLAFSPTLTSGTTNINAGSFSPLTTTVSREDGNQNIQQITLHYPPGLSGILAGIPLCNEEQANTGTCPPQSKIGSTIVSVGLGNEPFSVTGGEVFLTETYKGAPFGLSIVNPAVAGPFNLGKVIVRATLEIDPQTTALTVTTDNIPHILDGIPLQIKHVNVLIEREGFTFNPTSCNPMAITGQITSVEGATSPISVPYQATNCATLKFAPKLQVSTSAHTSKQNGASLHVKLTYPPYTPGTYANIAKVKVDLPKALPSRLTTLQKACLASVFEKNPAACPAASIIGKAKATTPVLPVPLQGPVYFVSHGNEAFPSLTIVLSGYGITIDLTAQTDIHNGITSSTFHNTPDQPVNTFELELPQGPYSALAANTNLCQNKTKLNMPTAFTAQNNQQIHQTTKITVTNCPTPHHKTKHNKKKKKK
jgi:uncharacterized repeat protein (TIGR01451 family)